MNGAIMLIRACDESFKQHYNYRPSEKMFVCWHDFSNPWKQTVDVTTIITQDYMNRFVAHVKDNPVYLLKEFLLHEREITQDEFNVFYHHSNDEQPSRGVVNLGYSPSKGHVVSDCHNDDLNIEIIKLMFLMNILHDNIPLAGTGKTNARKTRDANGTFTPLFKLYIEMLTKLFGL